MEMILNIVVCFNNKKEIMDYIKKLERIEFSDKLVICVVINDDTNIEYFGKKNENIFVYKCKGNIGYLNGALYGYKSMEGKGYTWKWVIISNTDIDYPDNQFIKKLLGGKYPENAWAIGPDIYCPFTGEHQNPRYMRRISKKRMKIYLLVYSNVMSAFLYHMLSTLKKRRGKSNKKDIKVVTQVYLIHGAYMILTEALIGQLMVNPFKGLMYHEEQHIAEIVYKNNKKCFFDPALKIVHNEHSSTGKSNFIEKYKQMKHSYLVNYRMYY